LILPGLDGVALDSNDPIHVRFRTAARRSEDDDLAWLRGRELALVDEELVTRDERRKHGSRGNSKRLEAPLADLREQSLARDRGDNEDDKKPYKCRLRAVRTGFATSVPERDDSAAQAEQHRANAGQNSEQSERTGMVSAIPEPENDDKGERERKRCPARRNPRKQQRDRRRQQCEQGQPETREKPSWSAR
jgi:hypothetical protein